MVLNPKHTVGRNNARPSNPEVNRAFSAGVLMRCHESWGAAPGWRLNAAPLALNTYAAPWHLGCTFMRCVREQDEPNRFNRSEQGSRASVSSATSCSTVRDRLPRGSRLRLLHRHPKFGLLGGAETHAPDLDNGQPPAHSAEPVFPPSEHLALPIPFGSPYHRRPNGRALGD